MTQHIDNFIFNIGMSCSGTTSLCAALNILGIPSVHQRTNDGVDLEELVKGNIEKQNRLFYPYDEEYRGFCDFAGYSFYEEVYKCYPKSKFILAIRPLNDWIRSRFKLDQDIYHHNNEKKLDDSMLEVFKPQYVQQYDQNIRDFRNFFHDKKDNYIELRLCEGEGWENLCKFLDKEIPQVPFPHLNKSVYTSET